MTTEQPGQTPAPTPAPAALSPEAQQLIANFRAIDPTRVGVGLDKIRPFYPKIGWSKILRPAEELESAGLLVKRPVLNDRGGVAYNLYTWKEV